VILGLPAGTPVQWAGNHRYHHAHTDTPLDPHSPLHRGFWFAHVGWYIGSDNVALCILYSLAGPARMLVDAWMRPRRGGFSLRSLLVGRTSNRLTDSPDLTSEPRVRGIGVHSGMPDHKVLEAGYLSRRL
jgi:hypothetical protein